MQYIINMNELKTKMNDFKGRLLFIDARAKDKEENIQGAIRLDVKEIIAGEGSFFADPEKIAHSLGKLGVSEQNALVFIGDENYRASAKALFALYQLGHIGELYILQGGYPAWLNAQIKLPQIEKSEKVVYAYKLRENAVVNFTDVQKLLGTETSTLIDSRSYERYAGLKEPKYEKAGHIPGAVNYHAKKVFNRFGEWQEKSALQGHFSALDQSENIIVSCGSGNSACLNAVALLEAGFTNVSLFPGGYGEWLDKGQEIESSNNEQSGKNKS